MSSFGFLSSVSYSFLYTTLLSPWQLYAQVLYSFCCNGEWGWFLISITDGKMRFLLCFSAFFQFWLVGKKKKHIYLIQFSSVAQLCPALCDPMDCSTPGFFVHHQHLELAQIFVHRVGDANQPSHPLLFLSPHAFNLSQHQDLFQGVSSSHQVVKVLELQLQYQFFQWLFSTDFI